MPKRFVKYHICDEEERNSNGEWVKTGSKKKEILDILSVDVTWKNIGDEYCEGVDKYRDEKPYYYDGDVVITEGEIEKKLLEENSRDCGGGFIEERWDILGYYWDNDTRTMTMKEQRCVIWKETPDEWDCLNEYRDTEVEYDEDWRLVEYYWVDAEENMYKKTHLYVQSKDGNSGWIETALYKDDEVAYDEDWRFVDYIWSDDDELLYRNEILWVKPSEDDSDTWWFNTHKTRNISVPYDIEWRFDTYSNWEYDEERNEIYRYQIWRMYVRPQERPDWEWIITNKTERRGENEYSGTKEGVLLLFDSDDYTIHTGYTEDERDNGTATWISFSHSYWYHYNNDIGYKNDIYYVYPYDNVVHFYENGFVGQERINDSLIKYNLPPSIRCVYHDNMHCKEHRIKLIPLPDSIVAMPRIWDFHTCNPDDISSAGNPVIEIDTRNWNIHPGITSMNYVFNDMYGCQSIIGLADWDVSNVTTMGYMFEGLHTIKELDVWDWDVSNVTSMIGMFKDCTELETIDLSRWDTSNVYDIYDFCEGCNGVKYLDLSNIDLTGLRANDTSPKGHSNMFDLKEMPDLETFKLDNIKFKANVTLNSMFGSLIYRYNPNPNVDVTYTYSQAVLDYFKDCKPNWTIISDKEYYSYSNIFDEVELIENLDLTDITFVNAYIHSFYKMPNLKTVTMSGMDLSNWNFSFMFSNLPELTDVYMNGCTLPSRENDSRLAYICDNLKRIHMCGCDEDSIRFVRQGLDNSDRTDVMILTAEKTGRRRLSNVFGEIDLKFEKLELQYYEYEYTDCVGGSPYWELSEEYEIISSGSNGKNVAIELYSQWEEIEPTSGFEDCVLYESISKSGELKIWFKDIPSFELKVSETCGSKKGYLILGKLDSDTIISGAYLGNDIQYSTAGISAYTPTTVSYPNDGGEHFIEIVFKDRSNHSLDRAYVGLPDTYNIKTL